MTWPFLLLAVVLLPSVAANFGCGCGLPPPPCPAPLPPLCPALPPPCPPPRLCPLQFCPPPLPCPPPPPPPPPQFCPPPPPPPPPSPCMSYQPAPSYQLPPPQSYIRPYNDCCCRCGNPCQFRAFARMHGSKIFQATEEINEDPTCNSKKLKTIMEDNLTHDASISKRAIQKAAEEGLSGRFNVICAKGDFSYVAYTETYCQASNDDITCYAFRPMPADQEGAHATLPNH